MDREDILNKLKKLRLSPLNLRMLEYWLSLSTGAELPLRGAFDPTAASDLLRGCGLFDVKPGESVRCRIAGMVYKLVFGANVVGQDWLALTPARHRQQRMIRYSAVAQGAIGVARRVAVSETGDSVPIEELMLPFADVAEDGTHPVLVHTDWRPEAEEWFGVDPTYAVTLAEEFHLFPLD